MKNRMLKNHRVFYEKSVRVTLLIIILTMCFASCSDFSAKKPATPELDRVLDEAVQKIGQTEEHFLDYQQLHAGGYLVVLDESPENNPYGFKFVTFNDTGDGSKPLKKSRF